MFRQFFRKYIFGCFDTTQCNNSLAGPQGIQGPKGETGPKGDVGPAGPQGIQGPVGPEGDVGPKGETGPKGDKGDVGPQGIQGPKGDVGPKGETGPKGDVGPKGETGPKGDKGDVGPAGPRGGCDPADIASLQNQINELKIKLDSLAEKRPSTRFADILFVNDITAQDGTSLKGNTPCGKFDYSLEFVTDGTLKIINDNQSLDSKPAYINMEVKGEGTLTIMIIQTLIHKGTTHVFKKPLCVLTITAEQRNYSVTRITAYSVDYMHDHAEKKGSNKIDNDS